MIDDNLSKLLKEIKENVSLLSDDKQLKDTNEESLEKRLSSVHSYIDSLEKSAKNSNSVWVNNVPFEGTRYGHIGSGSKNVLRKPGRPVGTGKGLTPITNLANAHKSGGGGKEIEKAKKVLKDHPDMKIGSFVHVQHPHKHASPIWCKVTSFGYHGVTVSEPSGISHKIRWDDVHDVKPAAENSPETFFELAKLSVPMAGTPASLHDLSEATKELKLKGMKNISDIIHDLHPSKREAYIHLLDSGAPVDPVESTLVTNTNVVSDHINELIEEALSHGANIDKELLLKLPKKRIVEVLKHHFSNINKKRS